MVRVHTEIPFRTRAALSEVEALDPLAQFLMSNNVS